MEGHLFLNIGEFEGLKKEDYGILVQEELAGLAFWQVELLKKLTTINLFGFWMRCFSRGLSARKQTTTCDLFNVYRKKGNRLQIKIIYRYTWIFISE